MNLLTNFNLAKFAFVPLNDRTIPRYAQSLNKVYKKSLKNIYDNNPEIVKSSHPQSSKYRNISRGHNYTSLMVNSPIDSNVDGHVQRLVPLVTDVKGKQTTVGMRKLEGVHTINNDIKEPYTSAIEGYTVTHPKYKNQGSKALLETMSGYAKNRPNEQHFISGASSGLDRLYRKQANGMNLPSNLRLGSEEIIG